MSLLISIVILPLTTPYLSTYDYGIVGVVSSYLSTMLCIAPLGLHLHLTNSFFEIPNKYQLLWGRIFSDFLISGLLFGLLNMGILYFVIPMEVSLKLLLLCIVGSIQIFVFAAPKLAEHLYPLVERPKPLVFTNLFASICGISISFILVYYFRLGYWGLLSNNVFSSIIAFAIFSFFLYRQYGIKPILERKLSRLNNMLRTSLPLIPHTLGFVLLSNSARIVMSIHHVDYDEIGLYTHGCVMGDYILIVTLALTTAISPYIQRAYREGDYKRYRRLFYLNQGVALMASFLICIWMSEVYTLLIHNDSLRQSSSIATYICFAQCMKPLYVFMSEICFIERKTKTLLWLVFVPGFTNLLICYVFIPIYGFRVAVYSTMLSYWTQLFMPFFVPYFKSKTLWWLGSRWRLLVLLLAVLTLLFVGNSFAYADISIKILISLLAVSIFFMIFKKMKLAAALPS